MAPPPGSHIRDYQLVEILGEGGMGQVYRAVHTQIGRVVAIKVLRDKSTRFMQRFFNEARIQAGLRHENIAALYDYFEFNGQPCIIMEYVDGQTVQERIQAHGRLDPQEAIAIFHQTAAAIAYLHEQKIIHRDIKPNNIKISSHGEVKLLDFGIAKDPASPQLTRYGSLIGTQGYLSPEQIQSKTVDVRSDVWSLGILFYEMLIGQLPFNAETPVDLAGKICTATYTSPSSLDPAIPYEVDAIIAKCLQKKPSHRYPSARQLLQEMERLAPFDSLLSLPHSSGSTWFSSGSSDSNLLILAKQYWPVLLPIIALVLVIIIGLYI